MSSSLTELMGAGAAGAAGCAAAGSDVAAAGAGEVAAAGAVRRGGGNAEGHGVDIRAGLQIGRVALRAGGLHIRHGCDHSGVGGLDLGGLAVAGVADVAEVAERVRLVPAGPIRVDGILALRLVAVLAGRGLRTALRLGRLDGDQGDGADRHQGQPQCDECSDDASSMHVLLLL